MPSNMPMFGFPSFISYPNNRRYSNINNMNSYSSQSIDNDLHGSSTFYPYYRNRPVYSNRTPIPNNIPNATPNNRINVTHGVNMENRKNAKEVPKHIDKNRYTNTHEHINQNIDTHKEEPKKKKNFNNRGLLGLFSPNQNNDENDRDYIFEIMGIKLDMGDIMIILLLYFLYTEGVEDQGLFFSLIFLLIS